jgi:ribose 5-phosphate isomerase B
VRILVGADDEGAVAETVVDELRARGHDVRVLPTEQWPDVARRVGDAVASGEADQGMLFCWTGTGTTMAANKVPGVRAALCGDAVTADGARRWNDANVLALSLRTTSHAELEEILDAWFSGAPSGDADDRANVAHLDEIGRSSV